MEATMQLGYLVFGVARPARWSAFCEQMLGLPAPVSNIDGSAGWRIDGASHRLILQEDAQDDLLALGLDCGSERGLRARVEALRAHGHAVEEARDELRRARRVSALWTAADPAGNAVELFTGLEAAPVPFTSSAFPGGFRTGALGLGHAVLIARDLTAMERFYAALGFGVTERLDTRVGPIDVRGTFLHCNRRHHSLALFAVPSRKRLHHFMLQANAYEDVGRALERARRTGVPLSLDLGQHPSPESTFSFYASTPSGFDFEIGAGSQEIDPARWAQVHTTATSSWGHTPQLRLKLRAIRDLVAMRLAG